MRGKRVQREPSAQSLAEIPEVLPEAKVIGRGSRRSQFTLAEIRRLLQKTQVDVAAAMACGQEEVSRVERRRDVRLSTLAAYAKALGVELEVSFVLDASTGHRLVLAIDPKEKRA